MSAHGETRIRPLALGFALSLGVHLLLAAAVASWATQPANRPPDEWETPATPPEEVVLGIERSKAATITWIGYEHEQEHQATQSEVEQAAQTLDAGAPAFTPFEIPPDPFAEPRPDPPTSAATEMPREPEQFLLPDLDTPAPAAEPTETQPQPQTEPPDPEPDPTPVQEPQPRPEPPAPQPPTPPAEPQDSSTSGEGGDAGDQSDREADGFSRERPLRISPGRPVAAEGLTIRTSRPRWTHYTLLTTSPRNPLVEIRFRRDGTVFRATIDESSGSREVDQPLLDAIYTWTAEGEALDDLPEAAPGADPDNPPTLRIHMRILLRR